MHPALRLRSGWQDFRADAPSERPVEAVGLDLPRSLLGGSIDDGAEQDREDETGDEVDDQPHGVQITSAAGHRATSWAHRHSAPGGEHLDCPAVRTGPPEAPVQLVGCLDHGAFFGRVPCLLAVAHVRVRRHRRVLPGRARQGINRPQCEADLASMIEVCLARLRPNPFRAESTGGGVGHLAVSPFLPDQPRLTGRRSQRMNDATMMVMRSTLTKVIRSASLRRMSRSTNKVPSTT